MDAHSLAIIVYHSIITIITITIIKPPISPPGLALPRPQPGAPHGVPGRTPRRRHWRQETASHARVGHHRHSPRRLGAAQLGGHLRGREFESHRLQHLNRETGHAPLPAGGEGRIRNPLPRRRRPSVRGDSNGHGRGGAGEMKGGEGGREMRGGWVMGLLGEMGCHVIIML